MELLKQLYCIYSPSGQEKQMRRFIRRYVNRVIPGCVIDQDTTGNLYVTKGTSDTYPCIAAHMDQVQKVHSRDFCCVESSEAIFGFSRKNKRQEGLGADDKNGIWIALKCLEKYPSMKCAFFVQEETGCVGSSAANMDFFKDCRFVLQCDRKGCKDFVTSIWGDLSSPEFQKAAEFEKFGYQESDGLTTDVGTLKDNGLEISVANISCGYYEPHTDHEFTVKADLLNCLALVEHIIENCTDVYPHVETYSRYNYGYGYYGSYGGGYYGYFEQYDELTEVAADMLSYYPDLSAQELYQLYHSDYKKLSIEDYEDIIHDLKRAIS